VVLLLVFGAVVAGLVPIAMGIGSIALAKFIERGIVLERDRRDLD
jgi:uncharacterized membrane protein YdfJ with MMPL/SSD domain